MTRRIMVAKTTDAPADGELPIYDSATDSWSNTKALTVDSATIGGLALTGAGTSFPGGPTSGDMFYRTDIRSGMMFRWNGTYWLSDQLFTWQFGLENIAATTEVRFNIDKDLAPYVIGYDFTMYVESAQDVSNYWTISFGHTASGTNTLTTLWSRTTVGFSTGNWYRGGDGTLTSLIPATGIIANMRCAKTAGTPGNIYPKLTATYRLRAT